MLRRLTVLALAAAALALFAVPASARVPASWIGAEADGPLVGGKVDLNYQLGKMRHAGAGSVRFSIFWDLAQPYASWADVPASQLSNFIDVNGMPTDWSRSDKLVGLAVQHGLRPLPVIQRAPEWAREHPKLDNSPPSSSGVTAYANFLSDVVHRYGHHGAFWNERPDLPHRPVGRWQVWNEPDGSRDWSDQPGIPAYVQLLKPAHDAIKAADPKAKVVLAGLVGRSWKDLAQVYRLGGRKYFDVAAIHPFTLKLVNVMKILKWSRRAMRRHHDAHKPLVVSEMSWPSAQGKVSHYYGFEVTQKGEARKLTAAYKRLAHHRRQLHLDGVFWSTWLSRDRSRSYSFDYAGLLRYRHGRAIAKPAYHAFKRVAHRLER
jgi:hypothetical protein